MTNYLETFYTFPVLDETLFIHWQKDMELQRHLVQLLAQLEDKTESGLMRLVLKRLFQTPENKKIQRHLIAYTARYAWRSVSRIRHELETVGKLSDSKDFCKDLYQLSYEAISDPSLFYKNYDLDRTESKFWLPSLKTYIRSRLDGLLCDKVRTMEGFKTYKRSGMGLLVRTTKKQLKAALLAGGIKEQQLPQYLLLWQCFEEIRKPAKEAKTKPTSPPAPSKGDIPYEAITQRYNSLCKSLPDPSSQVKLTAEKIETRLKQMGVALRQFIDPPREELDRSVGGEVGEQGVTIADRVSDPTSDGEVEALSQAELSSELMTFIQFLNKELNALPSETERITFMLHGMTLVQKEVGQELEKDQSTVGRQYKKVVQSLLERLAQWALANQGLTLDSDSLQALKAILVETVDNFYLGVVDSFFLHSFKQQPFSGQDLLRLRYLCQYQLEDIAQHLNQPTPQLAQSLTQTTEQLQTDLQREIEARIQHVLKPDGPALAKLEPLAEIRLLNAPYPHPAQ